MRFDVNKIRQDFPALEHKVCGKPFISVSYTHLTLPTILLV